MLMQQYKLQNGSSQLVCWLEEGQVKPGYKVQLKNTDDPELWWDVVEAYTKQELADIKGAHNSHDWHKNDFHGRLKGLKIS